MFALIIAQSLSPAVPYANEGLCLPQSQACWATRENAPPQPEWKWLQGHLEFTMLVMAKSSVQADCLGSAFRSWSHVLVTRIYGCHVASSRCLWTVQSNWCWCGGSPAGFLADGPLFKEPGPQGKI
jgi:hypothetical protein